MLSEQKPTFDSDVKQLLFDGLYDAFMSTFVDTSDDPSISAQVKQEISKSAQKFAQAFVDKSAKALTDAIDAYIRSIGITIQQEVPGTSVLSTTMGPVSGNILIMPNKVKIS